MVESLENETPARKGSNAWFLALVLVAVGGYAYVNRLVETDIAWGDDLAAAQAKAREMGSAVLIDFTATGCVYCVRMDREVFTRADVAESMERFENVRLYCSDAPDACARYGVQAFPSFVVIDPDGKPLVGVEGFVPADEFMTFVERASELAWPGGRVTAADPSGAP